MEKLQSAIDKVINEGYVLLDSLGAKQVIDEATDEVKNDGCDVSSITVYQVSSDYYSGKIHTSEHHASVCLQSNRVVCMSKTTKVSKAKLASILIKKYYKA